MLFYKAGSFFINTIFPRFGINFPNQETGCLGWTRVQGRTSQKKPQCIPNDFKKNGAGLRRRHP
jgi:hypothetical protein